MHTEIPIKRLVLFLCAAFAGLLILQVAEAASIPASCTLSGHDSVESGTLFTMKLSLTNANSAVVRRDDGTLIATSSLATSTIKAFATNVLGAHTYTVMAKHGTNKITCQKTVTFTYTPAPVDGYDIVIVAGQSNAVGRGRGPYSDSMHPDIDSQIVQIGRIGLSNMQIVPIGYWQNGSFSDGLQFWQLQEDNTDMAFALSFAHVYAKHLQPGRKLLIVPAAYTGTSIMEWLNESATSTKPLYPDMLARVKAALALPGDNRVVAFLWQQAEADVGDANAGRAMNADMYLSDLNTFFSRVRRDIPSATPFPILAGLMVPHWLSDQPAEFATKTAFENSIQQAVKNDGFGAAVSSANLTSNEQIGEDGGDIHFNADSLVTLGRRYYTKWAQLTQNPAASDPELAPYVVAPESTDE